VSGSWPISSRSIRPRHEPLFSVRAKHYCTTELFTDCTDPGGRKVSDFLFSNLAPWRHEVTIIRGSRRWSPDARARVGSESPSAGMVFSSSLCLRVIIRPRRNCRRASSTRYPPFGSSTARYSHRPAPRVLRIDAQSASRACCRISSSVLSRFSRARSDASPG
jgi:hypothetical protein